MAESTISYETCAETYATLQLYPGDISPETISDRLGLQPTDMQRVGEQHGKRAIDLTGWSLSTQGVVDSTDSQDYLEWLLELLLPRAEKLRELRQEGAKMDIVCFWVSAHGHGGPTLSPAMLEKLASVSIEIWYDVYFND